MAGYALPRRPSSAALQQAMPYPLLCSASFSVIVVLFCTQMSCFQAKKMAAVGAKEETFDVWMKQESDTVQALGMAYAERETIEASYRVIQQVSNGEWINKLLC